MLATCLDVVYEEGDFYYSQGHKKGSKVKYNNGYLQSPNGFGGASNLKASRLILYIEVEGKQNCAWIDRYFKDAIGRLTDKRRKKIISTMPANVEVEEFLNSSGKKYYVVSEEDMDQWLGRTGIKIN